MRKVSKILLVIAIILAFSIMPQISFAKGKNPTDRRKEQEIVSNDISNWDFGINQEIPEKVTSIVGFIIKLLRNVSIILTVLVITVLGIKYMIGSVEQKADYKKAYVNIIIGVVLVTMVTSIIDVIFSAAQNIA